MSLSKNALPLFLALGSFSLSSGCIAAAAGAGAEGAYVATQETRTAGETLDDQRITASVKAKLIGDKDISALSINVDTYKRSVVLKGTVGSQHEADRALDLARSVSGVISVRSELKLG